MRPINIVLIFALALFATTGFAAKKEKADICHFDMDYGVWKQISISGNAVEKHFNNHDDGFPDDITLGTNTLLDDGCEPVPLETCPCWTAEVLNSVDGIHSDGSTLLISTQPAPNNYCEEYGIVDGAYNTNHVFAYEDSYGPGTGFCQAALYNEVTGYARNVHLGYLGDGDPGNGLTLGELQACFAEVQACVTRNTTP